MALRQPSSFADTLEAAQCGEEWGMTALWVELNPRLLRFLRVRHHDHVEDVASETWLRVNRNLRAFHGCEVEFRAWFFTIARCASIDWIRSIARRPAVIGGLDLVAEYASPDDPCAAILDTLDTDAALSLLALIPPSQSEVILLRVIAGLDAERVATIVGKSTGAVRVQQHRGLRHLAQLVSDANVPTRSAAR
jgi:RNA polymerase sigma-70 factor (ECF subfamily)